MIETWTRICMKIEVAWPAIIPTKLFYSYTRSRVDRVKVKILALDTLKWNNLFQLMTFRVIIYSITYFNIEIPHLSLVGTPKSYDTFNQVDRKMEKQSSQYQFRISSQTHLSSTYWIEYYRLGIVDYIINVPNRFVWTCESNRFDSSNRVASPPDHLQAPL